MGVWRGNAHLKPGARMARVSSSLRHPVATATAGGQRARRLVADRSLPRRAVKPGPMASVTGTRPIGLAARDWARYGLREESAV